MRQGDDDMSTSSRAKASVTVRSLVFVRSVFSHKEGHRFMLRMTDCGGLAAVLDREAYVYLTLPELAEVLSRTPWSGMDDKTRDALGRVCGWLSDEPQREASTT